MHKIKYFLFGILLFTGLPLMAWGPANACGFFAGIHRTLYVLMMAALTFWVVLFVPDEGRGTGKGEKTVRRQDLAILFLQITSILVVVVAPFSDRRSLLVFADGSAARTLGLVFTAAGYLFMNWAILTLGRQFSLNVTIQKGHELVTRGPYRVIRHPRYLGVLLFLSGISLVFRSKLSLLAVLLTLVVLLWRISDEEKLMRAEFKEQWDTYAGKTWRLVPFLY